MRIDIVTILPELFAPFMRFGVCGRAVASGRVHMQCWNPRDYAAPPHHLVDDRPYGGGSGMVLLPAPLLAAARAACAANAGAQRVYLTPRGELFNDALAREFARLPGLVLLCGRYRGIDERAVQLFGGREVSVGNYVLSGGEPAACAVIDATLRHVPHVLGNADSPEEEAFAGEGLLDAPCYTRPAVFDGLTVPAALRGGNHEEIRRWRQQEAEKHTRRRPDLLRD